MTLHCNRVKLWPCPEWVAKMCVHEIEEEPPIGSSFHVGTTTHYDWALERYLMWVEAHERYGSKANPGFAIYKQNLLDHMNDPELKVWIE